MDGRTDGLEDEHEADEDRSVETGKCPEQSKGGFMTTATGNLTSVSSQPQVVTSSRTLSKTRDAAAVVAV